jgi:hypothetical protein
MEADATPPPLLDLLQPDEQLHGHARTRDLSLILTDRRIVVGDENRIALDIPYPRLRRVQLDVERSRPATLVLVPDLPEDEPQVLAIPHDELQRAAAVVALIGQRFSDHT